MRIVAAGWIGVIMLGATARLCIAQTTDPATQPTTVPVTQPATAPTVSTTEPTTEPTTESTTEPATLPSTEPATQSATKPTTRASTKPVAHPTSRPAPTPIPLAGIPEGTLFPDQIGWLARKPHGKEIDFIFEKDGKLTAAPVLPNLELMRMENAIAESSWKMRFRASGRITEYKARNYIMLDHAVRAEEERATTTQSSNPAQVR